MPRETSLVMTVETNMEKAKADIAAWVKEFEAQPIRLKATLVMPDGSSGVPGAAVSNPATFGNGGGTFVSPTVMAQAHSAVIGPRSYAYMQNGMPGLPPGGLSGPRYAPHQSSVVNPAYQPWTPPVAGDRPEWAARRAEWAASGWVHPGSIPKPAQAAPAVAVPYTRSASPPVINLNPVHGPQNNPNAQIPGLVPLNQSAVVQQLQQQFAAAGQQIAALAAPAVAGVPARPGGASMLRGLSGVVGGYHAWSTINGIADTGARYGADIIGARGERHAGNDPRRTRPHLQG